MKIGIIAGEASGDILGAGLMKSLQKTYPNLQVSGIGGPAMIAEGCQSLYDINQISLMGFFEPLLHLSELIDIRRGLYKHFLETKPDVVIGIDSPDFNIGLELKLKKAGIPTVHYVSPSVWAWRKKRIFKIAKAVDLMLTLFPFEEEFYKQHQVPVRCVGHPLADQISLEPNKQAAREKLGLDPNKTYIAILPGSRRSELKHLAQLFIATAHRCWKIRPNIEFITSAVNHNRDHEFKALWRKKVPQMPIKFFVGESHAVMEAADAVLVTSGTATLETMLYKRPMAIAFRTGPLTYQIAKRLIKVPFIGLPNLLANESLVPEFIQDAATPEKLSLAIFNFLDNPKQVTELQNKFTDLHLKLRRNASDEAAAAILHMLSGQK